MVNTVQFKILGTECTYCNDIFRIIDKTEVQIKSLEKSEVTLHSFNITI